MTLSMMRIEAANASRRWKSENDVREIVDGAPAAENLEDGAQPLSSRNNNSATQQQLRSSPINEQSIATDNNNDNSNENDGNNTDTNGSNSSNCNYESLPSLQHSIDDDANNNSNSSTIDFDSKIQQLFQNIQDETRQIFKAHEQRNTEEANNICPEIHRQNNNNIPTNDDRKRRSSVLDNILHRGGSDDDNTNTPKRIKALPLAEVAGVSAKVSDSNDVSFENEDREMEEDSSLDFGGSANNNDYDDMDFNESDKENDNSTPTELQAASTIGFTIGLTAAAPSPQQQQKQQHNDENDSIDWGTTTYGGMDSDEESEEDMEEEPINAKKKRQVVYRDDEDDIESESSVSQSDEDDDAFEYESSGSSQSKEDDISYAQSSDEEGSDSEVETDSDEEDAQSSEQEEDAQTSDGGRISKKEYAEHTDDLADLIVPHLDEHREKEGKEMQRFPTQLRAEILDSYLKENELIGRVNSEKLWSKAATKARNGKIVRPKKGGKKLGETSQTYEDTKRAETNAKKCTEDGSSELIARLDGDIEKTKEFARMGLALREKRKQFKAEHEKLGGEPGTAEEAMSNMPWVVKETKEEIQARVIKACANGGAVKLNVSKVVEHINDEDDIEGLVEKTVASMQANPNYDSKLCPQNQENAIKIMKSETCHYFLLVRSLIEMIGRGLAIIVEWTDEKGKTFSRIFVSVPDLLLFMYCQGLAKKITGDANDNVRPPEPTGGFIIIDILNGGKLINMNAHEGKGGFLHETAEGQKHIFQEMEVTEDKDGSLDRFRVSMPNTNVTLQLHQVALATGYSLGICTSIMELFKRGRCLHGVLEEGETLSCEPICPATRSLVRDGIAEDPSQRCDGDHTFGRDSIYLQGMSGVQGVEHRENVIRGCVEDKYGYWLNPVVIGKYRGGNPMPKRYSDRLD